MNATNVLCSKLISSLKKVLKSNGCTLILPMVQM